MNREILFRGKRLDNGEWVIGCLITDDRDGKEFIVCSIGYHWEEDIDSANRCIECFGFEVEPETVGQYTGLTIKGEKLFEHDQIRFRETEIDDWEYGTVVWHGERDYPAFDVEPWIDCDCNGLSYITVDCEVEIVGNKWDNPNSWRCWGMNRCGACKHYEPPRVMYEEWGRCGKERRYPKLKKPESWACLDYETKEVLADGDHQCQDG